VNEPRVVGGAEALAYLAQDDRGGGGREAPLALELLVEVLAFQELHREVRRAVLDPVVGDVDDVGALDPGEHLCFAVKAHARLVRSGVAGLDELDGDDEVQPRVAGHPDGAHAALREQLLHAVLARDDGACPNRAHIPKPSMKGRRCRIAP